MTKQMRASLNRGLNWQQTFAALKYRNYRLWFCGQMVSLFGTWMQSTAQGYLVFQLTHSPAYLGYVSFAAGIPSWLFTLYGGVIADRVPRRTLLVITQSCMMMLAFILAALAFTGRVQPWHIVVLAFGLGMTNAFDAPARQSFVLEMVDREDMTNAIALNSTMFNTAIVVGPTAGGVTYAAFGPAWCFTLNGISFVAVIIALLLMQVQPVAQAAAQRSAMADLKEGLRYVVGHPYIRTLIGLVGVANVFGASFSTLLPAWTVNVLHGDATTNGLLQSARGAGALVCALAIASLGRFRYRGRLLALGTMVYPVALLAFALAHWLPLTLVLLAGVGGAQVLFMNLANAMVQTQAADELRGRVMGIYSLTFLGLFPVGGLLAGTVAQQIGEPATVALGALITFGCAAAVWVLLPRLRALP